MVTQFEVAREMRKAIEASIRKPDSVCAVCCCEMSAKSKYRPAEDDDINEEFADRYDVLERNTRFCCSTAVARYRPQKNCAYAISSEVPE